jgi:peptidyl-prolyl cis-trans isomerase B (cyclophilin B)
LDDDDREHIPQAPVAATRIVDLMTQGFFTGISAHRVLPGFIVQFGDPWGDGFGGAGREPLRCETSPAPFEPLDVGIALAGRDTGSSQIFVTLARHPHLDTEYAIIGKASGAWDALAEGDTIRDVKVGK